LCRVGASSPPAPFKRAHLSRLPARADAPIALTIGNFDGVHRGHQAMLSRLLEAAEDLRLPSAVLTFDPHPREFFGRGAAPARLTKLRTKLEVFRAFGIERTLRRALRCRPGRADAGTLRRRSARAQAGGALGAGRRGLSASARTARATSRCCRAQAQTFSVEAMRTVDS
jgi:hypothetical protein